MIARCILCKTASLTPHSMGTAHIVCDGCRTTLQHNLDTASKLLKKTQKTLRTMSKTLESMRIFKQQLLGEEHE